MINSINYMIPDKFSQHICPRVPLELTRKLPPGAPNALLEIAGAARHVEHRVRFPVRGEPRAQRGKLTAVMALRRLIQFLRTTVPPCVDRKKPKHFRRRIRALGVGIRTGRIAPEPGMARAVH
jgi:hypothetical protein